MLRSQPAVTNLVRLPGAALEPAGDLVLCDVAREAASYIIDAVQDLVGAGRCAIATEEISTPTSTLDLVVVRESIPATPASRATITEYRLGWEMNAVSGPGPWL